jgi:hypothetical protein
MLMGRSAGVCTAVRGLVCRTPRQTEEGAIDARRRAILGRTAMLDRGKDLSLHHTSNIIGTRCSLCC